MKNALRRLCAPLLNHFESGDEEFIYKASHRKILVMVGLLFLALSFVSLYFTIAYSQGGGVVPFLVFLSAGLVCEIVGCLGSDRAVAKLWRNR